MSDSIKSITSPTVHGMVILNPDGTEIGNLSGLATLEQQIDGSQKTQIVDSAGDNYDALNPLPVSATLDASTLATSAKQLPDNHQVTVSNIASTPVISGFALETGGNLAAIKAKTDNIPAQGQALATASLPVVLPVSQITTLTPPAAITGFATSTKQDTVIQNLQAINSLTPTTYDYISLSYTGANLTGVVYKLGGSGGTTVSTLTLGYDGSDNLTSVTKS